MLRLCCLKLKYRKIYEFDNYTTYSTSIIFATFIDNSINITCVAKKNIHCMNSLRYTDGHDQHKLA